MHIHLYIFIVIFLKSTHFHIKRKALIIIRPYILIHQSPVTIFTNSVRTSVRSFIRKRKHAEMLNQNQASTLHRAWWVTKFERLVLIFCNKIENCRHFWIRLDIRERKTVNKE